MQINLYFYLIFADYSTLFLNFVSGGRRSFPPTLRTKDTSLREQRDEALFEAYTQAIREKFFASQSDAIDYVRRNKAPRFYIDGHFCAIIIGRMQKGLPTQLKGEQRKRKFDELFRLFKEEKAKPENAGVSDGEICMRIVEMPAPEFYLNYRAASGIIAKEREMRQKKMMMRWVK